MWEGRHGGQMVAAKALRVYLTSDVKRIKRVGCPRPFMPVSELITKSHSAFLQRGCDVEDFPSPKRFTANRRDNGGRSVCDGVWVDGER